MSYCHDKGIPHSEFLSWTPEDRAKTLAYTIESTERCSLCGTAPWEWEEDPYAYETQEKFCKGCYNRHVMSASNENRLPGTTVELVKVTAQMRARQIVEERRRRKLLSKE